LQLSSSLSLVVLCDQTPFFHRNRTEDSGNRDRYASAS
jgi:hypothetical protein